MFVAESRIGQAAELSASNPVTGTQFRFQPAQMILGRGTVHHYSSTNSFSNAVPILLLKHGEALQTRAQSWAVLTNQGELGYRMKEYSRIQVVDYPVTRQEEGGRQPSLSRETNRVAFLQTEGEIYYSSRAHGPDLAVIHTPELEARLIGTEYLVSVDPDRHSTRIRMLDGKVEVRTPSEVLEVKAGEEVLAMRGQPLQVTPLQGTNLVQWWLYYPGVVDPLELAGLFPSTPKFEGVLESYARGSVREALERWPGDIDAGSQRTESERLLLATMLLSAGAVEPGVKLLAVLPKQSPIAGALRLLLAAVQNPIGSNVGSRFEAAQDVNPAEAAASASLQLALSYVHQATNDLKGALEVAQRSVKISPLFGYAWARVAELQFSQGYNREARESVARALQLSPLNAQAHSVQGFLLAANYRWNEAIDAFDRAIELDAALGNAWLGRGLCKRRQATVFFGVDSSSVAAHSSSNQPTTSSWLSDLRMAALLEPTRSLTRSYLGKAYADLGQDQLARSELEFAMQLDPEDPTPWLYSAWQHHDANRPNQAVEDLRRSMAKNENRSVYRSQLLLDQDRAVRGASLARIYQAAGLEEVAVQEAARAVSYDYANYSAHQFLAESYNALRDPTRFNLRYESVWFNEVLLANLLSPVGAGLLSQTISQQEYSRLLERNRIGLSSLTEYRSDGQLREVASQHGVVDRWSYTLDLDYQRNEGVRPNNDLDRKEWYTQFKYQLNERDSLFLMTKYQDYESGDNYQHYDPAYASKTLRLKEIQAPILIGAVHREWLPGIHTTLLGGRLHSDVESSQAGNFLEYIPNSSPSIQLASYNSITAKTRYVAYLTELNQTHQRERTLGVYGIRFQSGQLTARGRLASPVDFYTSTHYGDLIQTSLDESFRRVALYTYESWSIIDRLRVQAGAAYDWLSYPTGFRSELLTSDSANQERFSPKAAFHWDLSPAVAVRGMYARTLGGLSYEESVSLEPGQLEGFVQNQRSSVAETEAGSLVAPNNENGGLALDVRLLSRTFIGLELNGRRVLAEHSIGLFTENTDPLSGRPAVPASSQERLRFRQRTLGLNVDQLIAEEWSVSAGWQLNDTCLRIRYPEILPLSSPGPDRDEGSVSHATRLGVQFTQERGFFAQAQARWWYQQNDGYAPGYRADESIYQMDVFVGWRFPHQGGEFRVGCLNATDQDYRLNSLSASNELPRERVWISKLRLEF